MTISTFILKNALRNKRRAFLSVTSVAVSLFLLVVLLVALRELTTPPEDVGSALRIAVRNRISLANPLPARQRPLIEKIPGVEAVTPFSWFGGKYKNEEMTTFAQFAVDPTTLRQVFTDVHTPDDQFNDFLTNRTACLVGRLTAEKYNLKPGDKMMLESTIYPCTVELRIAGIYSGTADDRNVMFHQKYLDEASGDLGTVGTWWVKAANAEVMTQVINDINAAFVNTSSEVRAETERAFMLSFVSMWGNIKLFVGSICTVVVFTLLLVTTSTMSMAIRERFRELAVLKALGYRRRELLGFILAESFGLATLGAIIGVGGAWMAFSNVNISSMTNGMMIAFEVTPRIMGRACLIAALLGILAAIGPALSMARSTVVDGLKTLD